MNNDKYQAVIGLEIHIELKTKSKMFCRCSADYFGQKPNTHTCPICLGLPGSLPFVNEQALKDCVEIGLFLNCQIQERSLFERKNYFYPDLPKGYQISQYRFPLCINGSIKVKNKNGQISKIRINRVHQEEDTAKLVHQFGTQNSEKETLIDFNRSGVPLVEIVTEPDFKDVEEVKDYAKKIQQICKYLGVSDADMEKGNMRLEANISVKDLASHSTSGNTKLPNYRVELKNINSFRFMVEAILYEIKRQTEALQKGGKLNQETRGWDENTKKTYLQRSKEEAHDYRYFPEPDIPPIEYIKDQILKIKNEMPELPTDRFRRLQKEYSLSEYDAEILTREKETADYFEEAIRVSRKIPNKLIANYIINKKVDINSTLPAQLIQQIIQNSTIVSIGEKELNEIIQKIISENQRAIEDYKKGKESVIMFLVGQAMRKIGKKIDTKIVIEKIQNKIKEIK